MSSVTEKSFLKDVASHTMEVLLDNGVYRHLRFSNNGSFNMRYDIVTYPGHFCYSGDMGCYVFNRLTDMFEFFRTGITSNGLRINQSYWAEKLEASCSSGVKQFDADAFKKEIIEQLKNDGVSKKVQKDILSDLEDRNISSTEAAIDFLYHYESDGPDAYRFTDPWEWVSGAEAYTLRFDWCLYAILYAIRTYDQHKQKAAA